MKKIGFVIPWYGEKIPGGAEMELRKLAHQLVDHGDEIEVLTTCVREFTADWGENYHKPGLTVEAGVPVRRFRVRKRDKASFDKVCGKLMQNKPVTAKEEDIFIREIVNSPDLYKYLAEHKNEYSFFVFIPYMFGTTYFGVKACPEKAVMIPCLHNESYAKMRIFKGLFPQLRGALYNAKPEMDLAGELYDMSRVKSLVLGSAMDVDITGDAERFRKKYKIHSPFVLYAGRKDAGKNVDLLMRYFMEYRKRRGGDLKLVLIGGGRLDVPKRAQQYILDIGFVPIQDKYDAYAAALTLCQPSRVESFSIVIMESWLLGRPVLVNDCCAVTRNFTQESQGGLYFKDYLTFEGCLDFYLKNPAVADKMAENGRKYVLTHFPKDVITNKFLTFLQELEQEDRKKTTRR